MTKEEFKKLTNLSDEKIELFEKYANFLIEYNNHTNLTAIRNKKDIYLKHFYDSYILTNYIDFKDNDTLLDIGSGAGFPGIVLAIINPNIIVTCLDSNNKKTKFLEELIVKLNLSNVKIVHDRAEDYAKDHLNEFDYVTARAVAHIDIISGLSLPFIKQSGKVLLLKGSFEDELELLKNNYKKYNISNYEIKKYEIDNQERNIIVLEKDMLSTSAPDYNKLIRQNKKANK